MLQTWEQQYPGRTETIFSAIRNVQPSQLADLNLFGFVNLETNKGTAAGEPETDACGITPLANLADNAVQYVDVLDLH
jgi:tRNA 2-thiocytidine biosynthesis protein TtcA